jgi:hypothetical protein
MVDTKKELMKTYKLLYNLEETKLILNGIIMFFATIISYVSFKLGLIGLGLLTVFIFLIHFSQVINNLLLLKYFIVNIKSLE